MKSGLNISKPTIIKTTIILLCLFFFNSNELKSQCSIPMESSYCLNAGQISVVPFPPGGELSGDGVTGLAFDPSIAGVGTATVSYSFDKKYYIDQTGTYSRQDISSTGTIATFTNDDDGITSIPLGFYFDFFGNTFSSIIVSVNGIISFKHVSSINAFNTNLNVAPDSVIAMAWDDWDNSPGIGTYIRYETIGDAPNRVFILDYDSIPHYNNDASKPVTTQLKLFESTNIIEIHTTNTYTMSCTQGIKGASGTIVRLPGRYNEDWGSGDGYAYEDYVAFIPYDDCSTSIDVEVLEIPSINAGIDQEICYGELVTLSGAGGVSYDWNHSITDGIAFQPEVTRNYTVTGTGANGCTNTDVVRVTVNPLPEIQINASKAAVCSGDGLVLEATGNAVSYQWDNSVENGVEFTPPTTATYTVLATSDKSCESTDEITVPVNPLPTVVANADQTTINGGESVILTGSGAQSYTWNNGAEDGVSIVPLGSTIYEVEGTDANGCQNTDNIEIAVVKSDQTITFEVLPNKIYGDAGFELAATSTSGLPINYESSDQTVVTINNGVVSIVGSGTAEITASQEGNANYNAAADVVQSLTVEKAGQTINFTISESHAYGDADFELAATSTSRLPVSYASSDQTVVTINNGIVSIVGAGTAEITASQEGNANYNAAEDVIQSLTIEKADQTITFEAIPQHQFGDADFELIAISTSELPITFTSSNQLVATISGNMMHITGLGETVITATQAGDSNYNEAEASQVYSVSNTTSVDYAEVINVGVYPNPAQNSFRVLIGEQKNAELSIYNSQGKLMYKNAAYNPEETIPVLSWKPGVYFIKFNKGSITAKLIKK